MESEWSFVFEIVSTVSNARANVHPINQTMEKENFTNASPVTSHLFEGHLLSTM